MRSGIPEVSSIQEREWKDITRQFIGHQVLASAEVDPEVPDTFPSIAWEVLSKAWESWEAGKGTSFKNYAWVPLGWAWNESARAIAEQRATIPKGHRGQASLPSRAMKSRTFSPVPRGLRGKAPKDIRWHDSPSYNAEMRRLVKKEIGPVVPTRDFFSIAQNLGPQETMFAGYYVFGEAYPEALNSWYLKDYDDVIFAVLQGHLRPTYTEVGVLIPTATGRPYSKNHVGTVLGRAAKKAGIKVEDFPYAVVRGVRHTRIRMRIESELKAKTPAHKG